MKEMKRWIQGTWDTDMLDEMLAEVENENEVVLEKRGFLGYWGTGCDELLAERDVNCLIITGIEPIFVSSRLPGMLLPMGIM